MGFHARGDAGLQPARPPSSQAQVSAEGLSRLGTRPTL
jgi:hypothetical protein